MIKVISIDPDYVRHCTCKNCASVIAFTRSDCTKDTRLNENGWLEYYWYFNCPTCDEAIVVHHGGKFD